VPVCDGAPLGAPCWIDLTSSDLERAQDFYRTVFGWTFESQGPSVGGYITASKDGRQVAGMLANVRQWPFPDGWSTYFHTADVDATLSAVIGAGAKVRLGRMQLPSRGVMAAATDPSGAAFRLWQPLEAAGFEAVSEPGAPVWHQLTTADERQALDFYRQVFGWQSETVASAGEFSYTTALFDGEPLLGIKCDEKSPPTRDMSYWSTFFGADDLDHTLQVIAAAGGTLLQPVKDTPHGRLATASDPTGVTFHLASLRS
jgi:predicted enzyme related to lactoylglutathione lyase